MQEKREITVNQSGQKQRFYRVRGNNEKSMNGRIGSTEGEMEEIFRTAKAVRMKEILLILLT